MILAIGVIKGKSVPITPAPKVAHATAGEECCWINGILGSRNTWISIAWVYKDSTNQPAAKIVINKARWLEVAANQELPTICGQIQKKSSPNVITSKIDETGPK